MTCCGAGRPASLDRGSSPDTAPPPAKRQQFHHRHASGDRMIADGQRPARHGGQNIGRLVTKDGRPKIAEADTEPRSPTKWTQTDPHPDPSSLAESLSQLMDDDRSDLNDDERRRLQQILRSIATVSTPPGKF